MPRGSRPWSDQEDAELLALKNTGVSPQRMSVRLKRTSRAIKVRLSFLRRDVQERPRGHRTGRVVTDQSSTVQNLPLPCRLSLPSRART